MSVFRDATSIVRRQRGRCCPICDGPRGGGVRVQYAIAELMGREWGVGGKDGKG